MGKFILSEQDVKKIVGEETGLIQRRVNEVESSSKDGIELVIKKFQLDLINYEKERLKENKQINEVISTLTEKIRLLEGQKKDNVTVNLKNSEIEASQSDDLFGVRDLCRKVNISGFDQTKLKYFLYENGIYDLKINEYRDGYFLKSEFNENVNRELAKYIHTDGKNITFSKNIIEYLLEHKEDILRSIARYEAKKKQYKISKKNVTAKQVKNYEDEIKNICKVSNNETSRKRYNHVYRIFAKTFPTFFEDLKRYREKHHIDGEFDITIVRYVVEIMQQGNLLLKIACELYVN